SGLVSSARAAGGRRSRAKLRRAIRRMAVSMPLLRRACEALCVALVLAGTADARPRFTVVDPLSPQERATFDPRKIDSLPSWERRFSIQGQGYKYRLVGQPPSSGTATAIPTIIV